METKRWAGVEGVKKERKGPPPNSENWMVGNKKNTEVLKEARTPSPHVRLTQPPQERAK